MTPAERVLRRLIPEGECRVFPGSRSPKGYGRVQESGGGTRSTHRVVYEHIHGPIPEGLVVMHTCDNPPCCRPEHLRLGTVADNNADRDMKGRAAEPLFGGRSGSGWQRHSEVCKSGHPFDEANTRFNRNGTRACRACGRAAQRRCDLRKKLRAAGITELAS